HRSARHSSTQRRQAARRHRRDHGGLRQHHGAGSQRPRLRLPRARRLLWLLLSGVSRHGPQDDQGAGRHLWLGVQFRERDQGFGLLEEHSVGEGQKRRRGTMANAMTAKAGPEKWWVPGDWNAFFGFGTNILVNVLVLTGLLRFV